MSKDNTIDLSKPITQRKFAALVGVASPHVSDMVARGVIQRGDPAEKWILDYTADLRAKAARWKTDGELNLSDERARLASEQADRVALQNGIARRELAPVSVIAETLADVGRQIAALLETIPGSLKRRGVASSRDLKIVEQVIAETRNIAAEIRPDWSQIDDSQDDD